MAWTAFLPELQGDVATASREDVVPPFGLLRGR